MTTGVAPGPLDGSVGGRVERSTGTCGTVSEVTASGGGRRRGPSTGGASPRPAVGLCVSTCPSTGGPVGGPGGWSGAEDSTDAGPCRGGVPVGRSPGRVGRVTRASACPDRCGPTVLGDGNLWGVRPEEVAGVVGATVTVRYWDLPRTPSPRSSRGTGPRPRPYTPPGRDPRAPGVGATDGSGIRALDP